MNRISAIFALAGAGALLASCSGKQEQNQVTVPVPVERAGQVGLDDRKVDVPKGEDAVKTALESLFKYAKGRTNAIPEGTKLLDLKVEDRIARINVSKEFNKLEGAGNEGESLAQSAIRRTLAQFKDIDKMVVLVEGKPFESQHADWSDPIPVRDKDDVARGDGRPAINISPGGRPGGGGE